MSECCPDQIPQTQIDFCVHCVGEFPEGNFLENFVPQTESPGRPNCREV